MVLKVKNAQLRARVFKTMNRYDKLAIKAYRRGDMKSGKKHESASDRIYKKNYSKMFTIK